MYTTPATMGRRIGAYLIDNVIITVIQIPFLLLTGSSGVILALIIMVCYYGVTEGSGMSASLGKYLCGLIVVDDEGEPLSYGQAFIRSLCRLLSALVLGVGFLIGLFSPNGLTLHDRLAGTMVAMRTEEVRYNPGSGNIGQQRHGGVQYPARKEQTAAQVIGATGFFAGRSYPVSGRGVILGRDQSVCDLSFPNDQQGRGISRTHCKLQYNPETKMVILNDLGSTYGTFLGNGVRVLQGQPVALRSGDEFYLATRSNVFRVEVR